MNRLKGEIVIVTGGSRGLGRTIVERFVAEGARVMTCATGRRAGEEAIREINRRWGARGEARFHHAEMGDTGSIEYLVKATVDAFGPPTVLINNAAIVVFKHSADATCGDFDETVRVNVRAYWWLSRRVYPYMRAAGRGAIVNLASTHPYQTKSESFPYNMSKGAILAMNKAMAVDFGPSGIRVNALLPGIVDTKPTREWLARFEDPDAKLREVVDGHPLNRMPTEEEVASAAVFLASEESSGITGIELLVDCGRQVKRS